jgi:hypothetical protein
MAQAVMRRPLTAQAQVRSHVGPCAIGGGRSGTRTGDFSENFFLVNCHSTNAPYSFSPTSLLISQL